MTLMLLAPFVGASAAHPHTHNYAGTAANNVSLNYKLEGNKVKYSFESAVVGVCADGSPLLSRLFPPEPVRDEDTDIGVGGGCFAFETVYGNDAGATLNVIVQDITGIAPAWIACVDVNGDGLCSKNGDEYNLCVATVSGPYSLTYNAPGCTIYANPLATLNPAVFVLVIGGVSGDSDAIEPHAGAAGFIYLF
ncbi:MAG TPA: hypothetical protein VNX21_08630 [Candidatus Thermoplasmatota archaeon]|nr:hypothetical protein [Candidatus Thermoplasmatota archaeon]